MKTISPFFCIFVENSFHEDKIKSVFIEGMNATQKLMEASEEWSKVEKSEHSRYAILSADHIDCKTIRCHFTFGTGVAVKNTEIISSLFAAQPVGKQKNHFRSIDLSSALTSYLKVLFNSDILF